MFEYSNTHHVVQYIRIFFKWLTYDCSRFVFIDMHCIMRSEGGNGPW